MKKLGQAGELRCFVVEIVRALKLQAVFHVHQHYALAEERQDVFLQKQTKDLELCKRQSLRRLRGKFVVRVQVVDCSSEFFSHDHMAQCGLTGRRNDFVFQETNIGAYNLDNFRPKTDLQDVRRFCHARSEECEPIRKEQENVVLDKQLARKIAKVDHGVF